MASSNGITALTDQADHRLRLARGAWLFVCLLAGGILILAIPGYLVRRPLGDLGNHLVYDPSPLMVVLNHFNQLSSFVLAVLTLGLATLLFRKRPDDRMALFLSYYLLAHAILIGGPIEMLEFFWPGLSWLISFVLIPLINIPLTAALLALFPDGRFVPPWTRWLPLAAILLAPFSLYLATAIRPTLVGLSVGSPVVWLGYAAWAGLGLGLVYGQIYRYRRVSTREQRQQTKWVLYGLLVMISLQSLESVLFGISLTLPPGTPMPWWVPLNEMVWVIALAALPISLTIAVMRYRLYDIDFIINRTLVYGALTTGVVGLYVLVVGAAGVVFQTGSNLAGLLLASILVAVLFKPVRIRLQHSVDRMMYGHQGGQPRALPQSEPSAYGLPDQETGTVSDETSRTLVSGRWLTVARLTWIALVVLAIALWIIGNFAHASEPPPSCAEVECDPFAFSAEDLAVLQDLQLPLGLIIGFWTVTNTGFGLVFFAIAGLIFWRKSNDWLGLLVSFTLVFLGAVLFTDSDDTLWRTYAALRLPLAIVYTLGFTALLLLFFYFPDGRFVPRRRYARIAMLILILLTTPFLATAPRAVTLGTLLSVGTGCIGLAAQIYRYRRVSSSIQRQQTKWVVFGLLASIVTMLVWVFTGTNFPPDQPTLARLYFLLATRPLVSILIPLLPVSIAFSILRYRLWDIDLVINRALVFGALTALIVALYVVVVGALGALFQASGNLLISLLATGLAALLFQPLRQRLQRGVNRLMYGERDDPVTVLTRLGQRLEATIAPDTALPTLVETVAQTLKLPYAAVELRSGGSKVVVAYGLPVDEPLRLPLVYQTETIGYLLVAPRSPGESFNPADMKLLETIAYQAGSAVHAVQLTADLQRSRQQLVTTREEERRRLRRDLHDGLGPHVASQMLTIDAISKLLKRDPAQAEALLQDLKHQTQTAISDIRRLVYDLRPPTLDDLGLVAALREGARHYQQSGLRITIDAPERLPPLPAAVEVAAYRIAQEALTNVVRHAQARECVIGFTLGDGLQLIITDDGRGLPQGYQAGVGLTSMRERAAELGGTCVVEKRRQGGTRVMAKLPMNNARQAEASLR